MAGDIGKLSAKRHRSRFLQMMPPHLRQRRFGIQDQLPGDVVRDLERVRIDPWLASLAKQREIIHDSGRAETTTR